MNYQKSLKIFEESIKSEITRRDYKYLLEKFRKWTGYTEYDDLLSADQKSIQRLVLRNVELAKDKAARNAIGW